MCPVFALLGTPTTLLILGAVAALLFGERLPEVVRTLGKGLWEVKNGVRDSGGGNRGRCKVRRFG